MSEQPLNPDVDKESLAKTMLEEYQAIQAGFRNKRNEAKKHAAELTEAANKIIDEKERMLAQYKARQETLKVNKKFNLADNSEYLPYDRGRGYNEF